MRGHIRERSPGNWAIVLDLPTDGSGTRRRKWHSFRGNKRGAQQECARLVAAMSSGGYAEPTKTTIAAFLDQWLSQIKLTVSARTFERYDEIVRKNIVPAIGALRLSALRPQHLSSAYSNALVSGRCDGRGGLSTRSVSHIHRVLKQALRVAVKWGLLVHNPADLVSAPKVISRQMRALNGAEIAAVLDHFRPTRSFIGVLLAALCGLRRGEITALRWQSVDFERGQISVRESSEQTRHGVSIKDPKSGRSRTVALPSLVMEELKRHRTRQMRELARFGVEANENTRVLTQADGTPVQPSGLTLSFKRRLATADSLPRIRFHDLRHSHATQLLASGIHPKIAQERLGHANISTTLDLYSHVLPGLQDKAAAQVDDVIREELNKRRVQAA